MDNQNGQYEKKIGKNTYKVKPFLVIDALRIKSYLMKLLAPTIGRVISGLKIEEGKDISDANIDGGQIGDALEKLFTNLGEDELISLFKRILKNTMVIIPVEGGKEKTFHFGANADLAINNAFMGNILSIYKIALFVLEVNFPDFFELVGGFGSRFQTLLSQVGEKNELQS